jgi:hypothetical protein
MRKSVIIGLLLLTAGLFGVATLNNIISHAMGQEYDNYYGDSSYSTYQTDDKKYECRTGPLEGFFVSSVEFCKFNKFDHRKDDRKIQETIEQELKVHLEKQEQLVHKGHQAPKVILVQQEQEVHKVYKVKEENKENQ